MIEAAAANQNITTRVVDQITNGPDSVTHPAIAGIAFVGAVAAAFYQDRRNQKEEEKFAAPFQNPAALEEARMSVRGIASRRRHIAPALALTVSAGIASAGLVGGFKYESEKVNDGARVALVSDVSLSMTETEDVGISRHAAVNEGIRTSDYKGRISVVEAAYGSKLRLPMESRSAQDLSILDKPAIDPNGGELASGIEKALSQLPASKDLQTNKVTREGALVVISDGTVISSPDEMEKIANDVKKSGVKVKVIVPGTPQGQYAIGSSEQIKIGINPGTFKDFGGENVTTATTREGVVKAVGSAIEDVGTTKVEVTWYVPLGVGLGFMALSGLMLGAQRTRRIA